MVRLRTPPLLQTTRRGGSSPRKGWSRYLCTRQSAARFTANVTYLGGAKFAFFMENDRTGAAWSQSETSRDRADLTTAESIAERPCLAHCYGDNATYANLSNFGTVVFRSSLADGKPLGSFATYQENMDDTGAPFGHNLAGPGALSANSTAFTVKQQSCD